MRKAMRVSVTRSLMISSVSIWTHQQSDAVWCLFWYTLYFSMGHVCHLLQCSQKTQLFIDLFKWLLHIFLYHYMYSVFYRHLWETAWGWWCRRRLQWHRYRLCQVGHGIHLLNFHYPLNVMQVLIYNMNYDVQVVHIGFLKQLEIICFVLSNLIHTCLLTMAVLWVWKLPRKAS